MQANGNQENTDGSQPWLHVVLYQPEIPQNTGNIGRSCVALGAKLWIVRPTAFRLDASHLRRAGLDYWEHLDWQAVDHWEELCQHLDPARMWLVTKFGSQNYTQARYARGDVLIIGRETNGLPESLRAQHAPERQVHVPMPGPVRSLNQATTAGIVMYEAFRQLSTVALILLSLLTVAVAVPPDQHDTALRTMCDRGLAETAAAYCAAQVTLQGESAAPRARWTMRQMECLCQAALRTPGDATSLWQAVSTIAGDYRREYANDPRLPWLAWQEARSDHLRAQKALALWLASPAAENERQAALQAVRSVLSRLDDIQADIQRRLPLAEPRSTSSATQAPSSELLELTTDCALLRSEDLLVRAQAYPRGSRDRIAAAADVDRTAADMLARSPADWPARDELLVIQATAGLEAGKRTEALRVLQSIFQGGPLTESDATDQVSLASLPSPPARTRAGVAIIETLCLDKDLAGAEQALGLLRGISNGPDVDLSSLRVLIARLGTSSASERPAQLQRVVDEAKAIGQQYGNYWRNRAEALLIGSVVTAATGRQPPDTPLSQDLITMEVRQLLAGGQTATAVAKLLAASQASADAQQEEQALQWAMQAGALLQRDKQWSTAAEVLAPIARAHPQTKLAATAHALAVWCLAQAIAAEPQNQQLAERYEAALTAQLSQWPMAAESLKSEHYRAEWLAAHRRFGELAEMWLARAAVAADGPQADRALSNWMETVVGQLPLADIAKHQTQLAQALRQGGLDAHQQLARLTYLATAMLVEPLTQQEAVSHLGLLAATAGDALTPYARQLQALVQTLDAAQRGQAASCTAAIAELDVANLPAAVRAAWTKSLIEACDALLASELSGWFACFQRLPPPEPAALATSPAVDMMNLKLGWLQAKTPEEKTAKAEQISQLAKQHPRQAALQIAAAANVAQATDDGFTPAVRTLKSIAAVASKSSEAYRRARWLEIRWQIARGQQPAARQLAKLTLSSSDIQPAWWKARLETLAADGK